MEDKQIIRLLWERAESALEALARRFGPRLLATARNILGSPQDAEETVSDTYFAIWNAIPPRQPEPLAGFVYKTGRNLALKRLRANTAQKRNSAYDLSLEELAGCIPGNWMSDAVDARELGQTIDAFLDTLSRDSRAIFLRRYWFGDSPRDIARSFDTTTNAINVRLSRTRNQLREYLRNEGYCYE